MGTNRTQGSRTVLESRRDRGGVLVVPSHVRTRSSLPIFAAVATLTFLLVSIVDPYSGSFASTSMAPAQFGPTQNFVAGEEFSVSVARDTYTVTKPPPPPAPKATRSAPAVGVPDPGTAQAIAYDMVIARGWGQGEFDCLVALWNRESHWNAFAHNVRSGAYGIPQALPGEKMASAGADWATNPATQITWGLGYIAGRYQTPCGAWASSQSRGWY